MLTSFLSIIQNINKTEGTIDYVKSIDSIDNEINNDMDLNEIISKEHDKHLHQKAIYIQRWYRSRDKNQWIKSMIEKYKFLLSANRELVNGMICPITHQPIVEPVVCVKDGKIYESSSIKRWLKHNNTSPFNRKIISSKDIIDLVELCRHYNTNKIKIGRHIWYCEDNVVHWVMDFCDGITYSPYMSFLESNPHERHGFHMNVWIDINTATLGFEFMNAFNHKDTRLRYPIQYDVKITINNASTIITKENLLIGCMVDVYRNKQLMVEGLVVESCHQGLLKLKDYDKTLEIGEDLQPKAGMDQSLDKDIIHISSLYYYQGSDRNYYGWGCKEFNDLSKSLLPNGKIHITIQAIKESL